MAAENAVSTMKEHLHFLMRSGHLEQLDRKVTRRLFSEVSVAALRKLLRDQYSIRHNLNVTQAKTIKMCLTRFYRGSESSRQSAVRLFQESKAARNFLDRPEKEINDELAAIPITDVDSDMDESISSSQESPQNGPATNSSTELTLTGDRQKGKNAVTQAVAQLPDGLVILGSNIPMTRPTCSPPSSTPHLFLDRLVASVDECGKKLLTLDVEPLLQKDCEVGWRPRENSVECQEVPCFLGLAEPAFFKITSCLIHFTVSLSSTGDVNSNSVTFRTPLLSTEEVVILSFRSVGTQRDTSQTDHPIGLVYALNDESASCFSRVQPAVKPSLWSKKLTIFDPPVVLDNVKVDSDNRLDFAFPRLPDNVKHGTHYHGYVFAAKSRTVSDVEKWLKPVPANQSLHMLISLILGPKGSLAPGTITCQLTCPVTFGQLRNPCRGCNCKHPNCFEGASYLQLYQACKDPRWKCVICGEVVQWYEARTDKLMAVLAKEFSNCDKVDVSLEESTIVFRGILAEPDVDGMDDSDS